jgi:hypothetical protein
MKSLIPTGQDYIGSGAWYQNSITKPSEIRFRASLAEGRRDVRLEKVLNRIVVNLADIVRRTNALSEITFHPQDLIRQPLKVQNTLL